MNALHGASLGSSVLYAELTALGTPHSHNNGPHAYTALVVPQSHGGCRPAGAIESSSESYLCKSAGNISSLAYPREFAARRELVVGMGVGTSRRSALPSSVREHHVQPRERHSLALYSGTLHVNYTMHTHDKPSIKQIRCLKLTLGRGCAIPRHVAFFAANENVTCRTHSRGFKRWSSCGWLMGSQALCSSPK